MLAECLFELHGAEKAVETLLLDEERFESLLDMSMQWTLLRLAVNTTSKRVHRSAIKMDGSLRAEFIEFCV